MSRSGAVAGYRPEIVHLLVAQHAISHKIVYWPISSEFNFHPFSSKKILLLVFTNATYEPLSIWLTHGPRLAQEARQLLHSRPPINHNSYQFRGRLQNPRHIHGRLEMASQSISMSSGLVAIALVVRSGAGPRFVFHYPPHLTEQLSQREARFGTELDISDEEDEDNEYRDSDESELEDGGFQLNQAVGKLSLGEKINRKRVRHVGALDGDDHYNGPNGEQVVPWEHLGEFSATDLEMILTPSRAFHKKKFELTLDPLYFVSYPMHIREDGLWKKKRPKKGKKTKTEGSGAVSEDGKPAERSKNGDSDKDQPANSDDADDSGDMTMFNVVFVLNLPKHDADGRILIYEHVIKKFNKALKHAQAQDNFVWKESEMILSMKEKAREDRRLNLFCWIFRF